MVYEARSLSSIGEQNELDSQVDYSDGWVQTVRIIEKNYIF